MWVHEAKAEMLAVIIEHCPAMKLVSGPEFQIYYANAAFREWSEYSMGELVKLGWKNLSVENESLEADIDAVHQVSDGYIQGYSVRKQYRTKSGTAHWGNLSVIRYPASGPVEFFFCLWEPYKNGTSTAFNLALEHCTKLDMRLASMNAELSKLTSQTDEDRYVVSTIKMIRTYPKTAVALFLFALSIFGANNVIELLQRVGIIQLPVQIQKTDSQSLAETVYAHSIADLVVEKPIEVTTPAGTVVRFARDSSVARIAGRFGLRSMPLTAGRIRRGGVELRYGVVDIAGTGDSVDGMRNAGRDY